MEDLIRQAEALGIHIYKDMELTEADLIRWVSEAQKEQDAALTEKVKGDKEDG